MGFETKYRKSRPSVRSGITTIKPKQGVIFTSISWKDDMPEEKTAEYNEVKEVFLSL
jgi:hypothetical protein